MWVNVVNSVSGGSKVGEKGIERDLEVLGGGLFVSSYTHALDPKKRLTIPAHWRASVGKPQQIFVLPAGGRTCLLCYPARDMERRIERIQQIPLENARDRIMARTLLASMSDLVAWDAQGRIRIKDELLKHAGLKNQVLLVGSFGGFELWNPGAWTKACQGVDTRRLLDATETVDS